MKKEIENIKRDIEKVFRYFYDEDADWIERRIKHLIEITEDILKNGKKILQEKEKCSG